MSFFFGKRLKKKKKDALIFQVLFSQFDLNFSFASWNKTLFGKNENIEE